MVFNIILVAVVLALIVNFLRFVKKAEVYPANVYRNIKNDVLSGLMRFKEVNLKDKNLFNSARSFFYSLAILLFIIMAISGFLLPLFWLQTDGVLLFIHVLIAPFFVIAITVSIALLANNLQFGSNDYKYVTGLVKSTEQKIQYWKKIYFWLFAMSVVINIASIVFAMYPLFGTTGQNGLIDVHRYSALALLVFTINYVILKYTFKSVSN